MQIRKINNLFYQKNYFNNDFIAISNHFASLQTVRREHKGIEPIRRVKFMY